MSTSLEPLNERETEHEQNDNWEWSDSFTEFIHDAIEGQSLKICTGLRPICNVNLDITDLGSVADSDNAAFTVSDITPGDTAVDSLRSVLRDDVDSNTIYGRITADNATDASLYDGYACHGDMFDLPFEDNTFDTVISDPPWLNLSVNERRALFDEVVRVTKPTGVILYNATWIPEHDYTNQFDLLFRQQLDFWGGPSFAACYRRESRDITELFDFHNYDGTERYPDDSPFWSEPYAPTAVSTTHNTDPKKVNGNPDYHHYCCPMCSGSQLDQLRDPFFESTDGQYTTYQCRNCEYRAEEQEIEKLAAALETAAEQQEKPISELEHIDYTPRCLDRELERRKVMNDNLPPEIPAELPWLPSPRTETASNTGPGSDSSDTLTRMRTVNRADTQIELTEYTQQRAHGISSD